MAHGGNRPLTLHYGSREAMLSDYMTREKLRGFVSSQPARYASGKLWPHGEWSLGYGRDRPDGGEWQERPIGVSARAEAAILDDLHGGLWPLNLSVPANSHSTAKRGLKGMSGYGSQMIKAAGHLIQRRYPRHRKTLGTVTLPPMSQEARAEVVRAWPELTRQWLQWLSRRLERQGLPPAICSVTEIQPQRLQAQSGGYLHWHTLWINHPGRAGNWAVSPSDVRTWVDGLLRRHCPSYTGGYVNVNVKAVEGAVAAYMAKYMSKGKQMVAEAVQDWGEDNVPATWWNMTSGVRRMVKAAMLTGRDVGNVLEALLHQSRDFDDGAFYAFLAPATLMLDNSRIIMGWYGRFQREVDSYAWDVLASGDIARRKGSR